MDVTTTSTRIGKFDARFFHMVFEEEIGRVKGHFGPINSVAFHPDGKRFVKEKLLSLKTSCLLPTMFGTKTQLPGLIIFCRQFISTSFKIPIILWVVQFRQTISSSGAIPTILSCYANFNHYSFL